MRGAPQPRHVLTICYVHMRWNPANYQNFSNILTHDSNAKNIQECKMSLKQWQEAEVKSRLESNAWRNFVFSFSEKLTNMEGTVLTSGAGPLEIHFYKPLHWMAAWSKFWCVKVSQKSVMPLRSSNLPPRYIYQLWKGCETAEQAPCQEESWWDYSGAVLKQW